MPAFNKFQPFVQNLANGGFNLASDALKLFLTNTAPTNTHGTYSQESANEIAAGNGYSTGGAALSGVTSSQTGGTETLSASNVVFTWTGAVGPFRYAVLYDSTSGDLIGWWDYGASVSGANGTTFTVSWASGILTIA